MKPEFQLPARKHLVHKAIEPRKLSASTAAKVALRDATDRWELKFDGCHVILIKHNGHAYAYSRTGEVVMGAMDRQIKAMEKSPYDNFVIFAEAWSRDHCHSDINGQFRTHLSLGDDRILEAVVFDAITYEEFMAGKSEAPFDFRRRDVVSLANSIQKMWESHGDSGASICRPSKLFDSRVEAVEWITQAREGGFLFPLDGFMRKDPKGLWKAGAGSGGENLKDKELLVVDLKVIRLIEGEGKFAGTLGAYECLYNGQIQRVGGGALTDKERHAIWAHQGRAEGGVGSIIEVHALGESTHGLLREPRFARFRTDKKEGE